MPRSQDPTQDMQDGAEGPGLSDAEQPGRRSGAGTDSVADQMRKDQQRSSNDRRVRDDDLPTPARDATA